MIWVGNPPYLFGETVAAPRHCDDITAFAGNLLQSLPEYKDRLCQVGLLNEGVRPDALHQVFLENHLLAVSDQGQQGIEGLRLQRNWLVVAQKQTLTEIDPKRTELVEVLLFVRHDPAPEKS